MKRLLSFILQLVLLCSLTPSVSAATTGEMFVEKLNQTIVSEMATAQGWIKQEGPFSVHFSTADMKIDVDGTIAAVMQLGATPTTVMQIAGTLSIQQAGNGDTARFNLYIKQNNDVNALTLEEWTHLSKSGEGLLPSEEEMATSILAAKGSWLTMRNSNSLQLKDISESDIELLFLRVIQHHLTLNPLWVLQSEETQSNGDLKTKVQMNPKTIKSGLGWFQQVAGMDANTIDDNSIEMAVMLLPIELTFDSAGNTKAMRLVPEMEELKQSIHTFEAQWQGDTGHLTVDASMADTFAFLLQDNWTGTSNTLALNVQAGQGEEKMSIQANMQLGITKSNTALTMATPEKPTLSLDGGQSFNTMCFAQDTDICGHWSQDYMLVGHMLGIVQGKDAMRFAPDEAVTRAELMAMLARAYGLNTDVYGNTGRDIRGDEWFEPYIRAGVYSGVMQGYSDGRIEPYRPVSRAEAAKMITMAHMAGWKPSMGVSFASDEERLLYFMPGGNNSHIWQRFYDVPYHEWFVPYIEYLADNNIASGFSDGSFRPYNGITRAEAVKLILMDLIHGPVL